MKLLQMKIPDYLLRASEAIDESVEIIEKLLSLKVAYWHRGNVYFDPRKFSGFGKLYGWIWVNGRPKREDFTKTPIRG